MPTKPIISLTPTPMDNRLELIGKILLVTMWCLTVYTLYKMPTIVPIHFNAKGQPDGYGNKMTALFLPVFATLIYAGLTQLNKYPHKLNYVTKITPGNARKQYMIAIRMCRLIKLAVLLIISSITLLIYLTTIRVTNGLGFWFLPLSLVVLCIPIFLGIRQSLQDKNKIL